MAIAPKVRFFFNRLRELPGKMLSETNEASHGVCAPRFCVSMGFCNPCYRFVLQRFLRSLQRREQGIHFPAAHAAGYKEIAASLLPDMYK